MVCIWLSWLNSQEACARDLDAAHAQETSGLRPSSRGCRVARKNRQPAPYPQQPEPAAATWASSVSAATWARLRTRTQRVPGILLENCQREAGGVALAWDSPPCPAFLLSLLFLPARPRAKERWARTAFRSFGRTASCKDVVISQWLVCMAVAIRRLRTSEGRT